MDFQAKVAAFVGDSEDRVRILADGLGVSMPTVRRWKTGHNFPQSNLRNSIVRYIDEHAATH
jgi:hypothetical protein